jgi:hypothetical protein
MSEWLRMWMCFNFINQEDNLRRCSLVENCTTVLVLFPTPDQERGKGYTATDACKGMELGYRQPIGIFG